MPTRIEVFRAFVDAVTHDPAVEALGITFRTWEDGDESHKEPALSDCPWVRISPHGGPVRRITGNTYEAPMRIHIETLTLTNDDGASMALYEVFEAVFASPGFDAAMQAVGVNRVTTLVEFYGHKPHYHRWEPAIVGAIYADGDIELMLYR